MASKNTRISSQMLCHCFWSNCQKGCDSIKDDPLLYVEYYSILKMSKLRVGDWRVFMDIDIKNKVMEILLIDHRGRIYKNL